MMTCAGVNTPPVSLTPPAPSSPRIIAHQRRRSAPNSPDLSNFGVLEPAKSSPARDAQSYRQKQTTIKWIVNSADPDLDNLRQLAISRGGLLNDEIRKKAWPKLLNIDVESIPPKPSTEVLHNHRDYQQVVLDVKRSLKRFPPGMEDMKRMSLQDQMVDVILWVLVEHDDLHYYQGYHDICVTFLLVVGEDLTFAIMNKLSEAHLRDFMYKTMEKTDGMMNYLYPIIGKASCKLKDYMEKAEVGTIFCLSWLITWYGHTLGDFNHIVRLYDYFIACHPIMPIYLAAAIVLHREDEVLNAQCEMPVIHSLLSRIPDDLPYEQLMQHAGDLYIQFPPESLQMDIMKQLQFKKELEEALAQNRIKMQEERAQRLAIAKQKSAGSSLNLVRRFNTGSNVFVKVTVWTLAAAFTAAAYSVFSSSTGWQLWGT